MTQILCQYNIIFYCVSVCLSFSLFLCPVCLCVFLLVCINLKLICNKFSGTEIFSGKKLSDPLISSPYILRSLFNALMSNNY